jgi:hypothetical protein
VSTGTRRRTAQGGAVTATSVLRVVGVPARIPTMHARRRRRTSTASRLGRTTAQRGDSVLMRGGGRGRGRRVAAARGDARPGACMRWSRRTAPGATSEIGRPVQRRHDGARRRWCRGDVEARGNARVAPDEDADGYNGGELHDVPTRLGSPTLAAYRRSARREPGGVR